MRSWLLAVVMLGSAVATGQETPRLAVTDFAANGAGESLAQTLSGVVANELSRLGLFQVSTSEALRSLVALERQRQLAGCAAEECADLTQLLKVDYQYVVSGKVSKLPGDKSMPTTFTLELTLLNTKEGRREGSDVQTGLSEAELTGKVHKSVIKLVSKVLAARSGSLLLEVAEAGAVVKVDDSPVGTTPLSGRLTLPAGPHFVQVEKEGFVSFQKEVRVAPNQLSQESVLLVPSPDYIAQYEARAFQMRLGAWSTAALGLGGVVTGAFFQWQAVSRYGSADQAGTFAFHRALLLQGVEVEGEVDHRYLANQLREQIQRDTTVSYIALGGAAVAAAASAVFWLVGDPPGRYQKFQPVDAKAKPRAATLLLTPTQGGGALVGIAGEL